MKNLKHINQQLLMLMTILGFFATAANILIVNSLVPLKDAIASLKTKVTAVQAKLSQYLKLYQAFTQSKQKARIDLAAVSFPTISSFRSYCLKNNMGDTAKALNFTLKELKTMPFKNLLAVTQFAVQEIESQLARLTTYGITQASVDVIKANRQVLYDIMGSRTQAQTRHHNLGVTIETEMAAIMEVFNQEIVPLVGNFANTQPDFYNDFQKNKRIGTPMTMHTRLNAHVISEIGTPCFGITVTVDAFTDPDTGKTYKAVSAVTNVDGNAEVSEFFAGPRTVTLSGKNITTHTFPAITFIRSKATDMEFVTQPAFNLPSPANKQKTNA